MPSAAIKERSAITDASADSRARELVVDEPLTALP
jgi:hypothetical protein